MEKLELDEEATIILSEKMPSAKVQKWALSSERPVIEDNLGRGREGWKKFIAPVSITLRE